MNQINQLYPVLRGPEMVYLGKNYEDAIANAKKGDTIIIDKGGLDTLSNRELQDLYGKVAGKTVSRASNRAAELRRLWKFLAPHHVNPPPSAPEQEAKTEEATMATEKRTPKTRKPKDAPIPRTRTRTTTAAAKAKPKGRTAAKATPKAGVRKAATSQPRTRTNGTGGPSKYQLLRDMFSKKRAAFTLDEIVAQTGFDRRNALTAIGILKNTNKQKPENLLVLQRGEDNKYRVSA